MPFMYLKGPLVKIFLTGFEKGCSVGFYSTDFPIVVIVREFKSLN